MARSFFRLTLLVGLLLSAGTCASQKPLVFQDDCSAVIGSATGEVLCFNRTENVLMLYKGTQFTRDVSQLGVLNVRDFGAKGDGTTNDTLALRSVSDAIKNDSIVFFPPGSGYVVSPSKMYGLDTQTGDHNGKGNVYVQVMGTIDPTYTPSSGTLALGHSTTREGVDTYTYDSYVAAAGRFHLISPLTKDYTTEFDAYATGLLLFDLDGKTGVKILGAGEGSEISFTSTGAGRIIRAGSCSYCEVAYLKFTGTQSAGWPTEQAAWVTGDGTYGGANHIHIHHVHAYKLSQFVYYGLSNTDYEIDHFTCESVHACTQSGGDQPDASATRRINIHDFSMISDPAGTDDAIAFFAPSYDHWVHDGLIDKNNTTGHGDPHQRGDCIDVSAGVGVVDGVKISNVQCRNTGGTFLGANINKTGLMLVAAAGSIRNVQINNVTVERAYFGLYMLASATDGIENVEISNLKVGDTGAWGAHLQRVKNLRIRGMGITKHSQATVAGGLSHSVMTNEDIEGVLIDGAGSLANSLGVQTGYPVSGRMTHVTSMNNPSDGFWFPATDITGPFEFADNRAENNGRYGFNGNNGVTAVNGLVRRNNTGSGNQAGLFNGF